MPIYTDERLLPYSPEQLFDLVADVERYPAFLPGWIAVRVLRREPARLEVEQSVDLGPMRMQFVSLALLTRPERVQIRAASGAFQELEIDWGFRPVAQACRVDFRLRLEPHSRLLALVAQPLIDELGRRVIRAFERRAYELYGWPGR